MLQSIRQRLALLLLALLPFHALLVTVGTKLIAGPGHAPLAMLAVWKEFALLILLIVAVSEIIQCRMQNAECRMSPDIIDGLIIALIMLSAVVSLVHSEFSILNSQFLYGFKYDFVPLVAFLVLRRVQWSEVFMRRAVATLLTVAGIVSAYAMISLWLPQQVFSMFGYSDLHSLYSPDGPLAPYQQIEGVPIRRAQSTFSGPNQLGLWLLTPFAFALVQSHPLVGMFALVAMFLSMSRSALLAACIIVTIVLWQRMSRAQFFKLAVVLAVPALLIGLLGMQVAPEIITRTASSSGHITRPMEAVRTIAANPFGLGLGTAGPASNRVSDTCVYLGESDDASWAANHPELCVFTGEIQVQPIDRECSCPRLPENWYLQIGIELGVLGMVLYIVLIVKILQKLYERRAQSAEFSVFLAFFGISIAALFLHAWEDSAVAYTVWLLAAVTLPSICRS